MEKVLKIIVKEEKTIPEKKIIGVGAKQGKILFFDPAPGGSGTDKRQTSNISLKATESVWMRNWC